MRLPERVRRQLLTETGLDYARLRPSPGSIASGGGDAGGRLFGDVVLSLTSGFGTAIVLGSIIALTGLSGLAAFMAALGAVTTGAGVATLIVGIRLRRRVPEEVESVFRVAGELAQDASAQLDAVGGSAEQVVRGLVLVSAIPAVTGAIAKRFLVLAPVVRPLLEGMLSRIVDRGLPTVMATLPAASPRVRLITSGLSSSRQRVLERTATLARWATMPLRVVGIGAVTMGLVLTVVAWISGLV